MTHETKVGVFVIIGLFVLSAGIMFLGDVQLHRRYRLNIMFDNAQGLPDKSLVKIAGVEVGKVGKISLDRNRAKITVWLRRDILVYSNATATIEATGIIGSKYVELHPGTPDMPKLDDNATIEGRGQLTFNEILDKFTRELGPKEPGGATFIEELRETIVHFKNVAGALDQAMAAQGETLGVSIRNLHEITVSVKDFAQRLERIGAEKEEDIKIIIANVRGASENLNALLAKIKEGEGAVGKLVSDKEVGDDLKETIVSIKNTANSAQKVLNRIVMIETYWDLKLRQDTEFGRMKVDAGLKVVPRKGKYYYVGGANLGSRTDKTKDAELKNTITVVMGRDFGLVTLYGGVIRSGGGAGLNLKFPGVSRLELNAEAYDFGRDKVLRNRKLDSPIYNAGARFMLQPWAWAWFGIEDMAEFNNFVASLNIGFKDEDIGYLLGLIGLAR